ncbi:hypothetical protein N658DRAFT_424610 [Parathielavia hyrcaniae]|uniref:EamA domain-containing protein n=1 Tax=Parathielavia hyrcaniae TaxID=113614 RepID=A0AAN6Q720_9PEZI|nr:hypothetical protein N658DRAFT_424610 [Parathielavia hyrcaniae]
MVAFQDAAQGLSRAQATPDNVDDDGDIIDRLPLTELGNSKPSSPFLNPSIPRSLTASPMSMSDYDGLSPHYPRALSPAPHAHRRHRRAKLLDAVTRFWARNRGVILVASAQLFGALMNLAARLLELEANMHPLQILFARMSMTTVLSLLYMWQNKVPDFPFGAKGIRGVLVIRGVSGFFGIYGMWYSMMYLPLAEATVITFLAPMLAGYICHILMKDPFTRKEQIASVIALAGVVLIARPTSLFGTTTTTPTTNDPTIPHGSTNTTTPTATHPANHPTDEPTPAQRLVAILVALLGVLGAAGAYTTIRYIGKRAHALITVTYFSVWSTLVSTACLVLFPLLGLTQDGPPRRISFAGLLPASAYHWFLLLSLGACGFVMQFMLTAGIGGEKSNRATAMVYTHMLFAAGFDRWVFGHRMGVVSLVGCGLIVGSALWAALGRKVGGGLGGKEGDVERGGRERRGGRGSEEGVPMLDGVGVDFHRGEEVRGGGLSGR